MSSESEDEFESADEGSDFEDNKSVVSHFKENVDCSTVNEDIRADRPLNEPEHENEGSHVSHSTTSTEVQETHEPEQPKECFKYDTDVGIPLSAPHHQHHILEDIDSSYVTDTFVKDGKKSSKSEGEYTKKTKEDFMASPVASTEESKKLFADEVGWEKMYEKDSITKSRKFHEKISEREFQEECVIKEEITENSDVTKQVKELEHSCKLLEERTVEQLHISKTTVETKQLKEIKEAGKVEMAGAKQETEATQHVVTNKYTNEGEGKNLESAKDTSSITGSSKSRPIRESKIGMKKPRERLGERLGAKKLGSRIEKKKESITSDGSNKAKVFSSKGEENVPKSALDTKQEEHHREVNNEDEARQHQQQQWEMQQERWQQVLQQNTGKREVSSHSATDDGGWGVSWGEWGSTLLSAASTFTTEIGRGVETVMETVEGSLGVPDPQAMAQEIAEQEKMLKNERLMDKKSEESQQINNMEGKEKPNADTDGKNEGSEGMKSRSDAADYTVGGFSLGSLVSGVSGALETASSKVLLGGLDTLEVIGRKAMDVIQDGDPGLRKKRAFLANKKPNLSLALQEARQLAAEQDKDSHGKGSRMAQMPAFDQAWEATDGPMHLEALMLMAKQCEAKMTVMTQSLPPYVVDKLKATNAEIKNTCELVEKEDEEEMHLEGGLEEQVAAVMVKIGIPINVQKINEAWTLVKDKAFQIQEATAVDGPTTECQLYVCLAALIAQVLALIHKGAEIALITPEADPLAIATNFCELTNSVCGGIETVVDQVCGAITVKGSAADPQVNSTITNIYLQAAGGNNYILQSMTFLSSILAYDNTKQVAATV